MDDRASGPRIASAAVKRAVAAPGSLKRSRGGEEDGEEVEGTLGGMVSRFAEGSKVLGAPSLDCSLEGRTVRAYPLVTSGALLVQVVPGRRRLGRCQLLWSPPLLPAP